jgi:hypothetical protein
VLLAVCIQGTLLKKHAQIKVSLNCDAPRT